MHVDVSSSVYVRYNAIHYVWRLAWRLVVIKSMMIIIIILVAFLKQILIRNSPSDGLSSEMRLSIVNGLFVLWSFLWRSPFNTVVWEVNVVGVLLLGGITGGSTVAGWDGANINLFKFANAESSFSNLSLSDFISLNLQQKKIKVFLVPAQRGVGLHRCFITAPLGSWSATGAS